MVNCFRIKSLFYDKEETKFFVICSINIKITIKKYFFFKLVEKVIIKIKLLSIYLVLKDLIKIKKIK